MRLTPHAKDTFRILAIGLIIVVVLASGALGFLQGRQVGQGVRSQLSERSESVAAALGASQVLQLKGSASDAGSATYANLKTQLAAIKRGNPDARSVYLMGRHANRQLFFFVDSEQPSSSQYSPAGDPYQNGTAADVAAFDNGRPFVEGPATDEYGTFISGLAPIFRPGSRQVVAVLGIDIDASTYYREMIYGGLVPVLAGIIIVLVILVFESFRRRNLRLLALRSELVSVASHELRNPITGIRWASESLQKIATDAHTQRMARAIHETAIRLQMSTDDILELSHAMSSRSLNLRPTNMTALLQEVIDVQSLSAQQKNVALQFDPSWPAQLEMRCDADQMKRALHNVLSNAIKYTRPHTAVTIAYKLEGGMHTILVADQGIGIPEAEQAKVWHGFYRASNATHLPGTGLGLYLVKTVCEEHGGSAGFTSVEGKGTTFFLRLPARP